MGAETIFINYRRDDSRADAGRLYDRLEACWPNRVFRDVSDLGPGVEWRDAIAQALAAADACIVVIGKNWLGATDSAGRRRLENPNDTVRLEILAALTHGVRLFPVLVGDARMPAEEELPPDLRPLARRNALEISEQDWDENFNKLVRAIETALGWNVATPVIESSARTSIPRDIHTAATVPPAPPRPIAGVGVVLSVGAAVLLIGSLGFSRIGSGVLNWVGGPQTKPQAAPQPAPSMPTAPAPIPAPVTIPAPPAVQVTVPSPPTATERRPSAPRPPVRSPGPAVESAPPQRPAPSALPLPQNSAVFVRCSGAPDVCAAIRAAFDEALERESLPGVRDPARAEVVIEANVSVVDERIDRQFGTTFVVRTYSVELTGEASRSAASVPMPAPRSFSFDARVGRERLAENAHLIAESAVERVQAFLQKR